MAASYSTTDYRYPNEHLILAATVIVVLGVIAFTAAAIVCASALFVLLVLTIGYFASRNQHQALLAQAQRVTVEASPEMMSLIKENYTRLQVEPVNVFIVLSHQLNAYTFGMDSPKDVVLYSSLFSVMDRDELQFILGHEMGHVKLGHTWLNTLVGGMAGIPSGLGAAAIMELAFRWWNRACEYSADRAGVLACGKPFKAISALVKLEAGASASTHAGLQAAIQHIATEDDDVMSNLQELLATHPLIAKRVDQIRQFTKTPQYHQMQTLMDKNLVS
jgi:Zn-dependent protease with chaperone function